MKRNKRIEKNREFCLGWLFNMSWDFLSLSLSPICSHVPAGGLLEEKFISRMIKLACTPIFIPPVPPALPLPLASPSLRLHSRSSYAMHPPFFSLCPGSPFCPPTPLSSCCAMSLSFCHINFIPKRGKMWKFPLTPPNISSGRVKSCIWSIFLSLYWGEFYN